MHKIKAFFKLIRWPNLLMIMVAQSLLNYMVIGRVLNLIHVDLPLYHFQFMLLMMSTVFMAAWGYAYNDVEDEKVDAINKEEKRIIGKTFSKKTGLSIAYSFLALSLIPAFYLSIQLEMIQLVFLHILIGVGLWYYSKQLKKTVLLGNIAISLFTAFSIFIVWLYHLVVLKMDSTMMVNSQKLIPFINQLVLYYSAFAFVISLIREITKDIEDKTGDAQYQMKTFVVEFGLSKTKILLYSLGILMLLMLGSAIYFSYYYQWTQLSIYLGVAIGIPLLYFLKTLKNSQSTEDFSNLSILAKVIMLAGILSMQLFYISYGL
ncbi:MULTISPECIES: geranylgeranylglycerol-phosphate geranylgeranyltransferase [unclassified Lentimicrobium]|uniref:geranylgeranylglycerol-phosphate geranylgeranyltransferase n=1 Tax=unclassified Lentimicrobium TaxID=2677434 RepID=UPI0015570CBA|nr:MULTISPECIES: geranylgeranylglycerol-phosphate geranylgeranyltransferase [unclassified Lentimicrobium]NPD44295.1 geranylgeranylglycerol-phosphate geranylgeranyltransferase [Lentimicrobium sp. S6]NPD84600.1 geranylgeranylglycerol-phosphate geranylgeranyltransferase [Lentimicrobium sp. L6]